MKKVAIALACVLFALSLCLIPVGLLLIRVIDFAAQSAAAVATIPLEIYTQTIAQIPIILEEGDSEQRHNLLTGLKSQLELPDTEFPAEAYAVFAPGLVSCLQDESPEVRVLAEDILCLLEYGNGNQPRGIPNQLLKEEMQSAEPQSTETPPQP